jgi:hypothetical protein
VTLNDNGIHESGRFFAEKWFEIMALFSSA